MSYNNFIAPEATRALVDGASRSDALRLELRHIHRLYEDRLALGENPVDAPNSWWRAQGRAIQELIDRKVSIQAELGQEPPMGLVAMIQSRLRAGALGGEGPSKENVELWAATLLANGALPAAPTAAKGMGKHHAPPQTRLETRSVGSSWTLGVTQ
ncbi:MAG: hypothetical protein JF606_17095 [Burkholderiales bacterium]|jgi:hypothetical protein|nr:hypothetical protein [Burkholderiales bacterium]